MLHSYCLKLSNPHPFESGRPWNLYLTALKPTSEWVELPFFLYWCLDGYKQLLKNNTSQVNNRFSCLKLRLKNEFYKGRLQFIRVIKPLKIKLKKCHKGSKWEEQISPQQQADTRATQAQLLSFRHLSTQRW